MASKKKFIIDTSAGINDANSLFLALSYSAEIDIVAITTVGGHAPATQVARNVQRILTLAGRTDIPVYIGQDSKDMKNVDVQFFGSDGFGDNPDSGAQEEHNHSHKGSKNAQKALLEYSKKYEGDLNLICLGPLTNIAKALEKDKDFGIRMKFCFIAGGNYYGRGNVTMSAEFNFYCDSHAAESVLENMGCPIQLAGWELCKDNALSWETLDELRKVQSEASNFMKKIEKFYVGGLRDLKQPSYYLTNELIMAAALKPKIVSESSHVFAAVETKGTYTSGQMIVDWDLMLKKFPNVELIMKVDHEELVNLLVKSVERL